MKSILKKVAGVAVGAILAFGMPGCSSGSDSSNESSHVHTKGTYHEAVAGTCQTLGKIAYYDCVKATCEVKLDEAGNPLASIKGKPDLSNHQSTLTKWRQTKTTHKEIYDCCYMVKSEEADHIFGDWTPNDDATVTSDETKSRICSVCQYKDTEIIEGTKIVITTTRVDDNFVKVNGVQLKGTEVWNPRSTEFQSGKKHIIPSLIVCDHEVTRGEFKEVMKTDPSRVNAYNAAGQKLTGEDVLNNPVSYVNWYVAVTYCNKLSIKEGLEPCYSVDTVTDWANLEYSSIPKSKNETWEAITCNFAANGYRLPTRIESEWLARGCENYKYAGSDTLDDVAWYRSNSYDEANSVYGTREVKTKAPNGFGLYDMSGNVSEWCWDWNTIYDGFTGRMARGGGIYSTDQLNWVDYFDTNTPHRGYDDTGFRVVRTAQ